MKSRSTSLRAFTLIELLTVIAIIGILAAIIIPTVGKVRDTARNAKCLSNLRQMGSAYITLSTDLKGRGMPSFPFGDNANAQNLPYKIPGVTISGRWWEAIQAYSMKSNTTPGSDTIFRCPADKRKLDGTGTGVAYGMNEGPSIRSGFRNRTFSLSRISSPSKTILFADSGGQTFSGDGANTPQIGQAAANAYTGLDSALRGMSFRHGAGPNYTDRQYYTSQAAYASAGGAVSNAAFYDGSVRAVKISEITYEMLYPELAK